MPKKTIITYGTFDMFHIGHLNLLRRINDMADRVIVAVSTDEFNEKKGKSVMIPYEHRAAIVRAIRYVDLVIPESSWEQKIEDINKYNVDIFAIGKDWNNKFDALKEYCQVIYLDRTKDISTTALKHSLKRFSSISSDDIKNALQILALLQKELP